MRLPAPVPSSVHPFKSRAASVVDGERIVGFDNERGKGDHCRIEGRESPSVLTSVDRLIEDFIAAVDTARSRR